MRIKLNPQEVHTTISLLVYLIRHLSILLLVFVPKTSQTIHELLKLPKKDLSWDSLNLAYTEMQNHVIGSPRILYKKLEMRDIPKYIDRFLSK